MATLPAVPFPKYHKLRLKATNVELSKFQQKVMQIYNQGLQVAGISIALARVVINKVGGPHHLAWRIFTYSNPCFFLAAIALAILGAICAAYPALSQNDVVIVMSIVMRVLVLLAEPPF